MAAKVGVATQAIGASADSEMFIVVTDGQTTKFLIPRTTDEEQTKSLLRALGSRLEALESDDPDAIIESMAYNMPVDITVSEPFADFDEAAEYAIDRMQFIELDFGSKRPPLLDPDFPPGNKKSVTAAAPSCPVATQDITVNIANRQKAIDGAGYGPLNPNDPNIEFWRKKANRWDATYAEAKRSICGNCSAFIRTPSMLECISEGLASGGSDASNGWDTIDAGELGYCEAFDFKCAAERTCDAWIVGGPVTEEK